MTLSVTLTLIVAIGFVLLLILQWRDLRQRVSVPVRWSLCFLRAVAYLLVLGMLLNPSLLIQKVLQILPPLVVMLDTSGSMRLAERANRVVCSRSGLSARGRASCLGRAGTALSAEAVPV